MAFNRKASMPPPESGAPVIAAIGIGKAKPKGDPSQDHAEPDAGGAGGAKASMEDATRKGAERVCSDCENWRQDGACSKVEGVFPPDDKFGSHCGYFDAADDGDADDAGAGEQSQDMGEPDQDDQ